MKLWECKLELINVEKMKASQFTTKPIRTLKQNLNDFLIIIQHLSFPVARFISASFVRLIAPLVTIFKLKLNGHSSQQTSHCVGR